MKDHYGKVPEHTVGLHNLDPEDDLDLIRRIVNRHGGCNFPEYQKYAKVIMEVDEEEFDD